MPYFMIKKYIWMVCSISFYYNGIAYRITCIYNLQIGRYFRLTCKLGRCKPCELEYPSCEQMVYGPGLHTHMTLITCSVKMVDELKEASAPPTHCGKLRLFLTKDNVSICLQFQKTTIHMENFHHVSEK